MTLFGGLHLTILAIIIVLAAAFVWLCRSNTQLLSAVRCGLGLFLALNEIIWWSFRYAHEGIHFGNLPLQLCDVAVWLTVAACFSDVHLLLEFAYFPGLTGAVVALLTPDLFAPWPSYPSVYFFLAHGGIVIAIAAVIYGGRRKFTNAAVWRSWALVLFYAGIVGTFDRFTGANYMYLMRKPGMASPLDLMGPWPWYLVSAAALALALFGLLWLPVRNGRFAQPGLP